MTKAQKPAFDNVTKPGDRFESFKPNAAMQAQIMDDMTKAGFVYENGILVGGPIGPGGKFVRVDGK